MGLYCEGSLGAALRSVRNALGIAPSVDRSADALQVWQETIPAAGSLVERYLRSRAISLPVPDCLRFHPSLKHCGARGNWPAMVAKVSASDGTLSAIHRTYLSPSGKGKAPVDPAKMTLGRCRGGAIQLGAPGEHLALAERIETALSVMQAAGIPTWSTLSAVGMRKVVLPDTVRTVTLCADGDDAGEAAALAAAKRLSKEGRRVNIARAPRGQDFNDVLMAEAAG